MSHHNALLLSMTKEAQEAELLRRFSKLLGRLERTFEDAVPGFNYGMISGLSKKANQGAYFTYDKNDKKQQLRQLNWEVFASDLVEQVMLNGDVATLPASAREDLMFEIERQMHERIDVFRKVKVQYLEARNGLPMVSGKWRREPYPARHYERLTNYVPYSVNHPLPAELQHLQGATSSAVGVIKTEEGAAATPSPCPMWDRDGLLDQLNTSLEGYLGQPYNYNDGELTEEWMRSYKDVAEGVGAVGGGNGSAGSGSVNGSGAADKEAGGKASGKGSAKEAASAKAGVKSNSKAAAKGGKDKGGAGVRKPAAATGPASATSATTNTSTNKSSSGVGRKGSSSSGSINYTRPTQDDVIRLQIENLLEIMKTQVQDNVLSQSKILTSVPPVDLGPRLKEVPVWGIDCNTRRMIEISIEDNAELYTQWKAMAAAKSAAQPTGEGSRERSSPHEESITHFIESYVLPTINSLDPAVAHDMKEVMLAIVDRCTRCCAEVKTESEENPPIIVTSTGVRIKGNLSERLHHPPKYVEPYAKAVLQGVEEYGLELFKIHPKGTGVVCTDPEGIPPHVVICPYLGEVYPPYRWCEKMDVVEQAQEKFKLKPTLPDFWNILLERPRQDKRGYGLLFVDASQKANMGSSCSHSCNANCTSNIVSRNGKLGIVLTTNRHVLPGEELCMDYFSITTSEVEWRASICLCGMKNCRGTFLHYATQDDLQQVLTQNCGVLWRYATLLRSCSYLPFSEEDHRFLQGHGMGETVFGFDIEQSGKEEEESSSSAMEMEVATANAATKARKDWILKYASDNLRFIEYERKALPMALMRSSKKRLGNDDTETTSKSASSSSSSDSSSESLTPPAPVLPPYSFTDADMEARSVMEQRIQSFVSCYSMVRKVLHAQPEPKGADNNNALAGMSPSLFPLKPLQVHDAVRRVMNVVTTIPMLLEKYILRYYEDLLAKQVKQKEAQEKRDQERMQAEEALAAAATATTTTESTSDGTNVSIPSTNPTTTAAPKKTRKSSGGSTDAHANPANGSDVVLPIAGVANVNAKAVIASTKRVIRTVNEIIFTGKSSSSSSAGGSNPGSPPSQVPPASPPAAPSGTRACAINSPYSAERMIDSSLASASPAKKARNCSFGTTPAYPTGFSSLRKMVLEIRELIIPLVEYSTTEARLALLCDILVLWANTSNYSMIQGFNPVVSDPVAVVARELGSNIPRSKLQQLSSMPSTAALSTAASAPSATSSSNATGGSSQMQCQETEPSSSQTVPAHEEVYVGSKVYDKYFLFCLLMQWFNAGTDDKITEPNLFGCVQLPLPGACFGQASAPSGGSKNNASSGHYSINSKQRSILLNLLKHEREQINPWPEELQGCFNGLYGYEEDLPSEYRTSPDTVTGSAAAESTESKLDRDAACTTRVTAKSIDLYEYALLGSPLLDISLGQMDALIRVHQDLQLTKQTDKSERGKSKAEEKEDNSQFDSVLPPELPAQWVQCETCKKWRRIAWFVDHTKLPAEWTCSMNTWDPERSHCGGEADWFDVEKENTLNINGGGGSGSTERDEAILADISSFKVGSRWDVFCNLNCLFYEATVVEVKIPKAPADGAATPVAGGKKAVKSTVPKIKFHFKSWSRRFDEWIELGSDRIQSFNLFTCNTDSLPNCPKDSMGITDIQRDYQLRNGTLTVTEVKPKKAAAAAKKKESAAATPPASKKNGAANSKGESPSSGKKEQGSGSSAKAAGSGSKKRKVDESTTTEKGSVAPSGQAKSTVQSGSAGKKSSSSENTTKKAKAAAALNKREAASGPYSSTSKPNTSGMPSHSVGVDHSMDQSDDIAAIVQGSAFDAAVKGQQGVADVPKSESVSMKEPVGNTASAETASTPSSKKYAGSVVSNDAPVLAPRPAESAPALVPAVFIVGKENTEQGVTSSSSGNASHTASTHLQGSTGDAIPLSSYQIPSIASVFPTSTSGVPVHATVSCAGGSSSGEGADSKTQEVVPPPPPAQPQPMEF